MDWMEVMDCCDAMREGLVSEPLDPGPESLVCRWRGAQLPFAHMGTCRHQLVGSASFLCFSLFLRHIGRDSHARAPELCVPSKNGKLRASTAGSHRPHTPRPRSVTDRS